MRERLDQFCYTKKDFKIEWFSGSGPGGQNRNKVQTCCRITHLPSGLTSVGQRERSRTANFRTAFHSLGEKIKIWIEGQISQKRARITSEEVVRTYHHADNRVKDHASGLEVPFSLLEKKLDELITARRVACSIPA